MANKSLARAFKRKMGPDESILAKIEARSAESSLLMNPSRRKIFVHICNFPCTHLRAISRATKFSAQNVRWHLGKLKDGNLISESSDGRRKFFRPLKNIIKTEECKLLTLLNDDGMRKVYLYIEKTPRSTQKKMCNALRIYQQRLSKILLSLEDSGIIGHDKIGREKAYSATKKVKELEEAFGSRVEDFEKALMAALESDGLNPKIEGRYKNLLSMRLNIGRGEQPILKVRTNPIRTLLHASR